MKTIRDWFTFNQQKLREQELIDRRESILSSLIVDLTTEESLEVFESVHSLFLDFLERRKESAENELNLIEKFYNEQKKL